MPTDAPSSSVLAEVLAHNAAFVANKEYEPFLTDAPPSKRLAIVTCMDSRLVELLPRAMGLHNGDVKLIKTAGAVISHPFGSVMRSLLIAVYNLGVTEIAIVGHHGCGMTGMTPGRILDNVHSRGISEATVSTLRHAGIDFEKWLTGFASPAEGVTATVELLRNHPLLPRDVAVHGMIMHPDTGQLDLLVDGRVGGVL